MPSSSVPRRLRVSLVLLACGAASAARAQPAPGFALERFMPSAPGAGWLALDALDWSPGFGGAARFSVDYAHRPLTVASADGAPPLAVVAHQAFLAVGLAGTFDRFRVSLELSAPLAVSGTSGTVGSTSFIGPALDLGSDPDVLSDVRVGLDARLVGEPLSPLRLGVSAQLLIPSGDRAAYVSDGTYRGALRGLVAGDLGAFRYAGHLGVHLRPLDDEATPGGPRGSELLFGAAAGVAQPLAGPWNLVVGPELVGQTALRALLREATGVELLLGARLERAALGAGPALRVSLGVGLGLVPQGGVPPWRMVLGVELSGQVLAPSN
jgi:hypothetical protein